MKHLALCRGQPAYGCPTTTPRKRPSFGQLRGNPSSKPRLDRRRRNKWMAGRQSFGDDHAIASGPLAERYGHSPTGLPPRRC